MLLRIFALLPGLLLAACLPAASRPDQQPGGRATIMPPSPAETLPTPNLQSAATVAPAQTLPPTPAPAPTSTADLSTLRFELEPVIADFQRPTHVTHAGDGSGRLFVSEQSGIIWIVHNGRRSEDPFLDLSDLVGAQGNEQGLLSIAFHPSFAANGRFFVNYTDQRGTTVVAEYRVLDGNAERADPASARQLLQIEQPAANHNGGLLKFGPDGYLYIGTGDGGAAGDPWGNGQKLDTLLGKLLRIDVDNGEPYAVSADNPFVGREQARPEIWAWGLRNPWRFSFDRLTGDLYIADVGQNAYEEVHFQPADSRGGENYGWNVMEGAQCFRGNDCDPAAFVTPVATYAHNEQVGGCSITGGYVYRGATFPQIAGVYLYIDYCTGNLWALRYLGGRWNSEPVGQLAISASSFGEDEAGELYLTDRNGGGLYRLIVR